MITLENMGWRQLSAIKISDISESYRDKIEGDCDFFLVLPYSCAVVNGDQLKEPNIELIKCNYSNSPEIEKKYGRNPRELQINLCDTGVCEYLNMRMYDRFFTSKDILINSKVSEELVISQSNQKIIKSWISQRYIRSAFPDAFNKRVGRTFQKIKKKLTKDEDLAKNIEGIYFGVTPEKENIHDDDVYDVDILVISEELPLDSQSEIKLKDFCKFLEETLKDTRGICINNFSSKSAVIITYDQFRNMTRYDNYDYMSSGGD